MKNKRILALLLAFVMVFTALPTSLLAAANPPTLNEALTAESDFEFDEATGTIKKYNGTDTDVVIPSKIGGVDVKEIGKSAFSKKNLTSVTIPEGVEIIDQGAFIGNLITELSLPSTVKRIEKVSFATNTKLSKVVFNEGLEYIGQGAFVNDAALTGDITIPSTVKTVMTSAFNKSGVTGIILKGDKDSSPVNLHSKLNGNSLEYVKSDDPYKSIKINFNTLGTSEADKYLELGEVKFKAETKEKLQAWLDENINVQFVANYVNLNDRTGESDKEITLEKVWDLDKFDLSNKFEVTANVNKDLYSEIEEIPGYSKPCISCSHTNLMIRLVINPVEEPATEYVAEDFTYDGASITGFSETGLKKFETLKEVNLPEKSVDGEVITAIGKSAFREKGIEKVTIPETVTLIDDFAFNSNKLTEIKLPSKLEKAGMSAFGNNTIAEVTIPGTLKEIPNGMFSTNLSTKIVIEEGVETIGASAFIGCKVESLEIPASVKEIGRMAFKGGSTAQSGTLKELILHEGLEKIGKDAFQNESLKEVNIPRSLKEIDNTSFRGNGQVVQLKTSNKAHLDFNNEKSLKNQEFILVEEAVTEYVAEDFTYDGASITGFSETGLKKFATLKEVNLPEKSVEGEVITAIGKSAFRGKGIEKVTIPETVTLIDDFAFNSNKLTEIKLPSKLEKAGMSAFGLNSIEEVTIPGTLKEIPNGMFSTNLSTKIVIEEGVETIGVSAFTGCKIERLEIPASVKIVGKTAFSGGSTPQSGPLKELILHEGLEVIEKGAFQKNNLKEVKMPSSLKEIGDTAFFGNGQVVILNTENYEHVRFNNDKSLKNQKFVFKGTVEPGTIEEIPEIKKEDIEKEVVQKGEEIDLTDNIKNLPAGSTVKDITEPMIDTNVVGDYTGKVEVTFSNGSKRIVEVAIVVIDKTELQNLVDKAKKIDLSNKTEESKKALEEAIKEAEEVLENATSQEEIDKAKEALQKA
ncbi:leucine-rich repeat protein, partial [Citroniella saccharovorans]